MCFVRSWSVNASSKAYSFLIVYDHLDSNFFLFLVKISFAVAMGPCVCRKIAVKSIPGYARKFIFSCIYKSC